jgi:DNA-binding NtrC family response regulator
MQNKILLVDDDDLVLACFERLLARDFDIETALGPVAALESIQARGPYAVIVSDLRMPGMSGLQLLKKAKELFPEVVGIVLSGNIETTDVDPNSVYRVLDKPCPTPVLAQTLNDALSHHHKLCKAT